MSSQALEELKEVQKEALDTIAAISDDDQLVQVAQTFLGRKGKIRQAMRLVGSMEPQERPAFGKAVNEVSELVSAAIDKKRDDLKKNRLLAALEDPTFDPTLPGTVKSKGTIHPLTLLDWRLDEIFRSMGFYVLDYPEADSEFYNFEALNIPADHPARDMQDTFWLENGRLLRTHTSNVQIRTMEYRQPPVRIVSPGMVFRNDDVDPTHSPVFHQIEGLWIDENATFADLKGILKALAVELFGPDRELRFRPSFFPFTEPSAEVDVSFDMGGKRGWLEILGAGMVDPAVLEAVGYDPEKVQGFAFGFGIERIAMLRYGIPSIRLLFENDPRFLDQF